MPDVETKIHLDIVELATKAFEGFCEDISALFNIEMGSMQKEVHTITVKELQDYFHDVFAAHIISAEGTISGNILLVFDKEGSFILPGVISMTPEPQIYEHIKRGLKEKTDSVVKSHKESGNLLVGSWDRVFREKLPDHNHISLSESFIGSPWNEQKKTFGFPETEKTVFILFETKIGTYPAFQCGVLFPQKDLKGFVVINKEEQTEEADSKQANKNEDALSDKQPDFEQELISGCARDIMQNKVVWISQDDTVETAISKMKENEIGYLMVRCEASEDNEILEGIVSRSDIAGAVSPYLRSAFAKWRRPIDDASLQIRIKWIMSRPVRTVKLDTTISVIMENMSRYGGRCLPVVDEESRVVGLVTVFEVFNALLTNNGISLVGTAGQPPLFI